MPVRIAVAEDQRLVRELLTGVLAAEDDFVLVGEVGLGQDAVTLACAEQPDILLLDVALPDMDGIAVARILAAKAPGVRVIALSVHEEPGIVRAMLEAGALGYVVKSAGLADLVTAIRSVMRDEPYLPPQLAKAAEILAPGARLTRRERKVLELVADGWRTADIARELGISPYTVDVHRRNIMNKLGVRNVAELTRYAVRHGIIGP